MKKWLIMLTLLLYLAPAAQALTVKQPSLKWSGFACNVCWQEHVKEPTFAWGTLTMESPTMTATCRIAEAGNVWNTSITEGQTIKYDAMAETIRVLPYECKSPTCPQPRVSASAASWAPWPEEVTVAGNEEYGERIEGVQVDLECPGQPVSELAGTLTASVHNGLTAGRPTERIFAGAIKGRMKLETYERTPVMTAVVGPA